MHLSSDNFTASAGNAPSVVDMLSFTNAYLSHLITLNLNIFSISFAIKQYMTFYFTRRTDESS